MRLKFAISAVNEVRNGKCSRVDRSASVRVRVRHEWDVLGSN